MRTTGAWVGPDVPSLFDDLTIGAVHAPHRVMMAPLTRMRAAQPGHLPHQLMRDYYVQRASAGLLVSEGTQISAEGQGYADTPGILKMMSPPGFERGDQWSTISWYAPCYMILEFGVSKPGEPKEKGTGYFALHLLTPETERTREHRALSERDSDSLGLALSFAGSEPGVEQSASDVLQVVAQDRLELADRSLEDPDASVEPLEDV